MAHKSRLAGFIIDCQGGKVEEHARFWSAALGFELVDPNEGGAGKYAAYGADQDELMVAEALAAARWLEDTAGALESVRAACESFDVALPGLFLAQAERTARVLAALAERWRRLRPKGALTLEFDRVAPLDGFDRLCQDLAVGPAATASR